MLVPSSKVHTGPVHKKRRIVILGSTGSIGCSAIEILCKFPDLFEVLGLAAGSNKQKLLQQAHAVRPRWIALSERPKDFHADEVPKECDFLFGNAAICELVSRPEVDLVLASIVGMQGLPGVLAAVKAGKCVALANKESLVVAGQLLVDAQKQSGAAIIPVDSEHSAIFQLLQGEQLDNIDALTLTASGGPFLNTPLSEFPAISVQQALKHPRWNMGAKISIDSATMMNKALELIEAYWRL